MSSEAELQEQLDLATRKLADAHKMASLGRLAAGIVHDINTPIGSIFSNNEVILRALEKLKQLLSEANAGGSPPGERAIQLLDTMGKLAEVDKLACERISGIIRSLKTFARVNESDLRKVDVNELLRNALKLTNTVFHKRIAIETDLGELPEVECYPGLLGQVFLNLIVNAGQAIAGDGKILVRTRRENGFVHVEIADTGHGIPAEIGRKIFAAGYTTKPIGEGTGLGLTISREIVEDTHGGKIEFESEMDKGTTFHVRVPVEQPKKKESDARERFSGG